MGIPWKWYVYIIECRDGLFYTGMTWNPSVRFEQHLSGNGSKYTVKHGVRKIVYLEKFEDLEQARHRELQIKDFSREKKRRLISGQWGQEW